MIEATSFFLVGRTPGRNFEQHILITGFQVERMDDMDLSVSHGILAVVAVVVGVIARFASYTVLVKVNRWLPEKATKIANTAAFSVIAVGLLAVGSHLLLMTK